MSYQVLARKYRPQTFKDVVGQDHVVQTLTNAINTGRIAHAFLFVGPRGIGKTSTARILAKALNCPGGPKADFDPLDPVCQEIAEGRSMDVLEIDGASNNGVDQVRELRENTQYAPTTGKFKIYIIDEVHMLSTAAFNALLKTLEEPPAHIKFIFATTEAHKVLPTILSRCQRFDLKRISEKDLVKQLRLIAENEGVTVSNDALKLLARNAEGGMRDAESAFDQLISFCGNTIEESDVLEIFGLTGSQEVWDLAQAIQIGEPEPALHQVRALVARGKDLTRLTQELLRHFRNLLVFVISPQMSAEELDADDLHHFQNMQPLPSDSLLMAFIDELVRLEEKIRYALVKDVLFEIAIIRLCQQRQKVSLEEILKQLSGGSPPTANPLSTKPLLSARPTPAKSTAPLAEPKIEPRSESKVEAVRSKPEVADPPHAPATPSASEIKPEPAELPPPTLLWERLVTQIKKTDILMSRPLDCCDFLGFNGNTLSLSMTAQRPLYDSLTKPASFRVLEEAVKKAFGSQVKIDLVFNERPPEPQSAEAPPTRPAKIETASTKAPAETRNSKPSNLSKADFENDPLIRRRPRRLQRAHCLHQRNLIPATISLFKNYEPNENDETGPENAGRHGPHSGRSGQPQLRSQCRWGSRQGHRGWRR
ncbi:MAG: DNA polymerase III subunit gamma/tau [Blastochloris sp.]|nr:DNA polymerase III subunit gamma/tau [Blastochloris sp.]